MRWNNSLGVSQIPITRSFVCWVSACVIRPAGFVKLINHAAGETRSTARAYARRHWQRTQRHGGAAGPGGLLPRKAVLDGQPLVARTPCHSAHADAVEHDIRALRRRVQIGLHGDGEASIQTPDDLPSHPRDGLGALRVEVEEAQLADAENIAGLSETVNHQRRPNSAASEYRYLVHELSSIIRRSCEGKPAMPP